MEHERALIEYFVASLTAHDINLSTGEIRKFFIYLNELKTWNDKINLTAVVNDKEILVKHFLDSMMGSKAIEVAPNFTVLDVGSGAGFPGIPLRIVREDLNLVLIEPNKKKVAFLRYILGRLQLSGVTVFPGTFENFCNSNVQPGMIRWILSRALNVEGMLPQFHATLESNGKIILYRSKPYPEDFDNKFRIDRQIPYQLPDRFGRRILTILRVFDAQA